MEFLTLREANITRQREWDPGNIVDRFWRMNELAGETGEVCNVLKKLHRERMDVAGSRATKADLAEELADVIICLDLLLMTEKLGPASAKVVPSVGDSLTEKGTQLHVSVSRLCLALMAGDFAHTADAADRIRAICLNMAIGEGIDLDLETAAKFNRTSAKMGLQTRLKYLV